MSSLRMQNGVWLWETHTLRAAPSKAEGRNGYQ